MKVLLVSASYYPVLGGLQEVSHILARRLMDDGHDVRVVTNRYPRALSSSESLDGIQITRPMFLWPEMDLLKRKRLDLLAASFVMGPRALLTLGNSIRTMQPHVNNLHYPNGLTRFYLTLPRSMLTNLVVSLHGDDVLKWCRLMRSENGFSVTERRGLNQFFELLTRASAVTACSQYLLDKTIEIAPHIRTKGFAIHNGIDIERFADRSRYRHGKEYLLAFGRLSLQKGFDLLIKAFAHIAGSHDHLDLIIAGTGEEQANLINLIEAFNLAHRVHLFGRATPIEVVRLLNGCRLAVVPSRWEPFGIVALETLAAGKPLVATEVGGIPEFVDGASEGIRLVEPNAESVAAGIQSLLKASLDASVKRCHRQIAAQYSWDKVADKYIEVYRHGIT